MSVSPYKIIPNKLEGTEHMLVVGDIDMPEYHHENMLQSTTQPMSMLHPRKQELLGGFSLVLRLILSSVFPQDFVF